MPQEEVTVFTDISIGTRAVGIGIAINGLREAPVRHMLCAPAKVSPVEAELIAIIAAVDLFRLLWVPDGRTVLFMTDCEAAIRTLYELGKFRSVVIQKLTQAVLKALTRLREETGTACAVRLTTSGDNPAHPLSREARKKWTDLLSSKQENS